MHKNDAEREAAMVARAEWHTGRSAGLVEAAEEVARIRARYERERAPMAVMVALDEVLQAVELLDAAASDQARREGFERVAD